MNVNPYYSISASTAVFFKGFLSVLSNSQKKIGVVAAIAFGILAACYAAKHYFFKISSSSTLSQEDISNTVKDLILKNDIPQLFNYLSKNGNKLNELNLAFHFFFNMKQSRNQFLKDILILCPNLKNLRIGGDITDADLKDFGPMPSLESLEMNEQTNDKFLKNFLNLCPNLKIFDLQGDFTDTKVKYIKNMKSLKHLKISLNRSLTDTGIEQFKGLVNLKSLVLSYCENITGSGLKKLGLDHLKSLDLSGCENFSDTSLAYINQLKFLEKLDLRDCPITNAGLQNLSRGDLDPLLYLKLTSSQLINQAITLNDLQLLVSHGVYAKIYVRRP